MSEDDAIRNGQPDPEDTMPEAIAIITRGALDDDGMVAVSIAVTIPYPIWQSLTSRIPAAAILDWNGDRTQVRVSVDAALDAFANGGNE